MPKIVSKTISLYAFKIVRGRPLHLLLRRAPGRKLPGAWQAVHGHIDRGETSAAAAARELVEETGLAAASLWAVDYVERVFDPKKDQIRLVPAFAALVKGDVTLCEEHDAARWLAAKDAMKLFTFENQRAALAVVERDIAGVVAEGREPNEFLNIGDGVGR